jgi:hypothetical protein
VSFVSDGWDDDELLAALREAVRARQAVPPEFVAVGKSAFAWHNIDAELAQLTYDSSRDTLYEPSLRAEAATIRALTFTSPHLTVELEVSQDSLLGQNDRSRRRDRLLRDPPDPVTAVPAVLPDCGRHRRSDRLDHAVTQPGRGAAQPAPSASRDRVAAR